MTSEPILHVATRAAWDAAVAAGGPYRHPSLDTEGFVHCSTAAQLAGTLARHFATADRSALVVLVVEPAALDDVRWERSATGGDEAFPHVYGAIPLHAVRQVRPLD